MIPYNTLNVKLSNCLKNATKLTLHLSSNVIHDSNFLHKLLLNDTQVSKQMVHQLI